MANSPILPSLPLEMIIDIFTEQARSAIVSRNVFARLFERDSKNTEETAAMHRFSPYFFDWLNYALLEYTLLQAAKLLDGEYTDRKGQRRRNVTCDAVCEAHPDMRIKEQLRELRLGDFGLYINEARNRLIAHSDEESHATKVPIGTFPVEVGERFYHNLQEFVNILHGGYHPLQDSTILNDVDAMISILVGEFRRKVPC